MPKPKRLQVVIDGYLHTTRLGREGEKLVTIEYSAAMAVEIAKLELMGRDLSNHLPILLRTVYEVSPEGKKQSLRRGCDKPKQKSSIGNRKSADA